MTSKEPQNVIEQAKGLLRLEIRPAAYQLKNYSSGSKANELITKDFFNNAIEKFKINDFLKSLNKMEDNELFMMLNVMKVADIEKILAFKILEGKIGERTLLEKGYYKEGTFRKELVEEYNENTKTNIIQKQLYISLD
ncbi:hypothetical protein [Rummeliibacillus sp. BSL5]